MISKNKIWRIYNICMYLGFNKKIYINDVNFIKSIIVYYL